MLFERIGKRRINLDYCVMVEELDRDGAIRVTMDQGKEFDDCSADAEKLLAKVDALIENPSLTFSTTVIPGTSSQDESLRIAGG